MRGVSFTVRAGEIVGIAGVDGNGQSELIDAIAGLRKSAERHDPRRRPRRSRTRRAREMLDAGLGHIPEDRQRRGLVLEFSIAENIALHDYAEPPDAKWGWLFPRKLIERARTLIREFDVRGGGPLTRAGTLSGGNQQKVVAAREIARDPKVLIAAQPTRGLDVGAIEFLHRRLVEERDEGRAILLVSLELDEILSLSDRILVLYEGEIVGEHGADVTEEEIGLEMLGGRRQRRMSEPPEPQRPFRRRPRRRRRPARSRRGIALRQRSGGIDRPGPDGADRVPARRPDRARDRPQPAARLPRHLQRRRAQLDLPPDDEHR